MRIVEINIKVKDVPEGWSIEAADFINKVIFIICINFYYNNYLNINLLK